MIKLKINNLTVEVPENTTLLEAALKLKIKIPTLCYNNHLKPYGGCRLCIVEIEQGQTSKIVSSCTYPVQQDLVVTTNSTKIKELQRFLIQLLLAKSPNSKELLQLAEESGFLINDKSTYDNIAEYLWERAPKPERKTRCILCGLCVRVCAEITKRHALTLAHRGHKKSIETPFNRFSQSCIGCGACAYLCPTDAITIEQVG